MNGRDLTLASLAGLVVAGAVRRRGSRGSPNAPSRTDFANLRPDDRLTVYHGTSLSESYHLLNGFDATTIKSRHYGGPRHRGLFVAPDMETARRFASYGPIIVEMVVRAKSLHGTDYSGVTGRENPRAQQIWKEWFPNSFRPYLSQTLSQKSEPQALLIGLVSPSQITRVWMGESEQRVSEGRWYTREAFLNLGLRFTPARLLPYGPKRDLRDLRVDTISTRLSYDQLLDAVAALLGGHDRNDLEKTLAQYARVGETSLVDLLVQVGFGTTAAKHYARRYRSRFLAVDRAKPQGSLMRAPSYIEIASDLFRESGYNATDPDTITRYAAVMRRAGGWGGFPPISGQIGMVDEADLQKYLDADAEGYAHELAWSRPLTKSDVGREYVAITDGHHRAHAARINRIDIRVVPFHWSTGSSWSADEMRRWQSEYP